MMIMMMLADSSKRPLSSFEDGLHSSSAFLPTSEDHMRAPSCATPAAIPNLCLNVFLAEPRSFFTPPWSA